MSDLPYFDVIMDGVYDPSSRIAKVFGKHIHWGYWENSANPDLSDSGCNEALDALSHKLLELSRVKNGDTVADVGCGFGGTTSLLNQNHNNLTIHAINIDARQIAYAKKRLSRETNPLNAIEFHQSDACELGFSDSHFDVVLAVECIFHFSSKEKFLKEAFRILKPGGLLVFSDFITDNTRMLRYLIAVLPHRSKFKRVFGNTSNPRPLNLYEGLASASGFNFEADVDVTEHTIPTYAMLRSAVEEYGKLKKDVNKVLDVFESVARKRLSQYRIYVLSKPLAGART